jgi:hypothetical protein
MSALAPLAEPAPALQPESPAGSAAPSPPPEDRTGQRKKTSSLIAGMRGN